MTAPYIVLLAILLVLFAVIGYVVLAVAAESRCDREVRAQAESEAATVARIEAALTAWAQVDREFDRLLGRVG